MIPLDNELYRGPSDVQDADCPTCGRETGEPCLAPDLFDAGVFYHRARFEAIGLRPEDVDGGAVTWPACLIPDQPPPTEGEGDVLIDLAEQVSGYNVGAWSNASPRMRRIVLEARLEDAIDIAARLCALLGVDFREAILERRRIGIERYGQPLRYGDGRGLEDAAQEAIDLAAYIKREVGP